MKKRTLLYFFLISCSIYILTCLSTPFSNTLRERSVQNQISYINDRLTDGADLELQEQYPEGYIFSNALFALALVETNDQAYVPMIDRCVDNLISANAKSKFENQSWNQYGAFYNGWVTYTLKNYINSTLFKDSSIPTKAFLQHQYLLRATKRAMQDSCYLMDSYSGLIWPGDNFASLASLDTASNSLANECLIHHLASNTDEDSLIYHFMEDDPIARGSSQALITYFMAQINLDQAKAYNETYIREFQSAFLTIDFIKEYKDQRTAEDIDSGPVINGIGSVATIMNVKAQSALGNDSRPTWASLNLAGLPINIFGKKRFLFGNELMFDIFMLWTSLGFQESNNLNLHTPLDSLSKDTLSHP